MSDKVYPEDYLDGPVRVHSLDRKGSLAVRATQSSTQNYASVASFNSSIAGEAGKEVIETWVIRILHLDTLFIALAFNAVLVYLVVQLSGESGLVIGFGRSIFKYASPVLMQVYMKLCHERMTNALNDGMAHYIGYLISKKKGYSIAAAGFIQSDLFKKISFAARLSFRSPCRKMLYQLSWVWMGHMAIVILTVFASVGMHTEDLRSRVGTRSCLIYTENGSPTDRGFPTLQVEMGVAEYVFGTSLGLLSSEQAIPYSTHVLPPQLIDTLTDGTEIVGNGFLTDIKSDCVCSTTSSAADLVVAGASNSIVQSLITQINSLQGDAGLATSISQDLQTGNITVLTVMTKSGVCAGTNSSSPALPVCKVLISNHLNARVTAKYMTDGTPASVAINSVTIDEVHEAANMSWVLASLQNALGGDISAVRMPKSYPGAMNPMLWWATSNMQSINAAYLNSGLETTFAMILRVGMIRTLNTEAHLCPQTLIEQNAIIISLHETQAAITWVFVSSLMILWVFALILSLPFMFSQHPIKPAIRFVKDPIYFRIMIAPVLESGLIKGGFQPLMDSADMWPRMDIVLRLGESLATKDDPEQGQIVLGKPKIVTNLTKGKLYC
ncbi:hypothetical protein EDD86DRAFT_199167 [Gorgonomyces haynaldii]|nr:hypothetical protein EDD86DRAFT_199167 [Gorgonomyces haynaldii]